MQTFTRSPVFESHWDSYNPNGSWKGSVDRSWTRTVQSFRDMDAVQPRWRELIRDGYCATTTASGQKFTWEVKPGWFEAENQGGYTWVGTYIDSDSRDFPLVMSSAELDDIDNEALTRYIKNAQEKVRAFEGLTFLGELRETLGMLRSPATALRKNFQRHGERMRRKTRKLKPGSKRFRDAVAGSWLEAVFGWMPLFSDIESAADALTRWYPPTARLLPVTGKARSEIVSDYMTLTPKAGPLIYNLFLKDHIIGEVKYRGRVKWDPSELHSFRYWGLDPTQILPTAWELIPYSFAIDYFTNIGDILSAWSFGSSRLAWTDRVKWRRTVRFSESAYVGWSTSSSYGLGDERLEKDHYIEPESFRLSNTYFTRGQYFGDLVPDFSWEIPGVGSRKWLNLSALASLKYR